MDFQIVLPGKTIAGKGALSRAGLEKYGKKPLIAVSYTHLTLPTSFTG